MKRKISENSKYKIAQRYLEGESVSTLSDEFKRPPSTIYHWIKKYDFRKIANSPNPLENRDLRRRIKKLENMLGIFRLVDCAYSAPLKHKLIALERLYSQYSVHSLCDTLNVPRGTFYNHILRNKRDNAWFVKRREELKKAVRHIYDDSNQIFGADKIRAILVDKGYVVSVKYVSKLMRELNIYSIHSETKTYRRLRDLETKKTNILKRNFDVSQPNKVWVSDVTCFKIKDTYFYICVFLDLFSRKALSFSIGKSNSTQLVKKAFMSAFRKRQPKSLTIHTDRGSPYVSFSMRNTLRELDVAHSFSQSGRPCDNAVIESFFSILKREELYRTRYKSEAEFRQAVARYVDFYNSERPHSYLNYKTPDKAERGYSDEQKANIT